MKKSILFLLALFSVTMTTQAAYYYRGEKNKSGNNWLAGIELTESTDGYYAYYSATAGAHQFKICTAADDWGAASYNCKFVTKNFNNTDIADIGDYGGDNCYTWTNVAHYIIVYYPNTKINASSNPIICASTFLPDDSETDLPEPEPEPTELAYNVTVPAGTKACYICGNMTGWNFTEMTKVDDTHYTITIEGAKKSDGYKYASGAHWDYVEKDASGNEIGDRTYGDGNDVVARWASVYDPDAVEQELTYSVTVPEGTYACYIAMDTDPAQEGWEFNEMTKVDDTHYTFTRTGLKNKTYKYTSGPGWGYVEQTAEGGNVADRTWAENDVVAKWASVYNPSAPTYDYYVIGTVNNWGLKDENFGMTDEDADGVYEKEVTLTANNKHELKINNGSWDDNTQIFGFDQLNVAYEGVSRGSGDGDNNVVIELTEDKTITVKFDKNAGKITLDGLTPVTIEPVTAYTVTVPAGTEKCYIVGEFAESNWNTFIEMDKVAGEDNKFTIEVGAGKKIAEATTVTKYKYARDTNWDNVEKDANGEEIADRTWSDNDVVASWATPAETHTYTVAGSATLFGEDWDNTINEMTLQDDGTYVWTATGVRLSESVEFKVIEDQNWDIVWPASNYVIEIGEDKANTPGTYDVNIYFNAAEAKADNTTGIYVVLTPATIEIAEYMDITMTNLQTEDYGGILALMGSEEVLGLSVQLFLNDYTGADKEYELNEASYLAMVSGWMETELPFVSGSMTKSTDATYGDKFAGTVIVYMDDKYIGLNITMYKKPLSKVDLTITGADVAIDLYNGVKITTTHDGKPVLVEFSSFEYLASNKYYDASLEMGDWETDDTYFRAFATEADVTISGNTLTLKGSFEAADAIYNLTISGTMPLVVTEGDNTNLLAQNGQTADAYITRTFESGNLYTVSFPFAMDESTTKSVFGSRVEVYEYTSLTEETDGLVLNFTKLSTPQIVAGTPYLVKPNRYAYGFGLSDVTISDANNPVTYTCAGTTIAMEPVLTAAAKATTNGKTQYWLAEDNNLYNKSVNLKGLRAIFNVQTNKSNVRARAAFNENVETGVEDIFSTDAPVKVIVNGQLIIIRDGEMYNVQGQLVK